MSSTTSAIRNKAPRETHDQGDHSQQNKAPFRHTLKMYAYALILVILAVVSVSDGALVPL